MPSLQHRRPKHLGLSILCLTSAGWTAHVTPLIREATQFVDTTIATLGHVTFKDAGAATIANVDLVANIPKAYDFAGSDTNILTGNPVTVAYASNGHPDTDATLVIISLEDSTP